MPDYIDIDGTEVGSDAAIAAALHAEWNGGMPAELVICSICGTSVPLANLNSHEASHNFDALPPGRSLCPQCGLEVDISEIVSHMMAHQMEREELQARQRKEDKSFAELQQRYGFTSGASSSTSSYSLASGELYVEDSECRVRGLMPSLALRLAEEVEQQARNGIQTQVALCGDLDFYFSKVASRGVSTWDPISPADDGWGCGYRNIQMLSSHLLHRSAIFREALFHGAGFVPTIPGLQEDIERSWQAGFDTVGCQQLGGRLSGTHKWIGTTECCTLLRSFGVACHIVGFKAPPGPDAHRCLLDWVWQYFFPNSNSNTTTTTNSRTLHSQRAVVSAAEAFRRYSTGKPPVYFQHDGHSRTIVGILRQYSGGQERQTQLLVFDPECRGPTLQQSLMERNGWQQKVKRGLHTLKKPEFEILVVEGERLALPGTSEASKDVSSNAQLYENGVLRQAR